MLHLALQYNGRKLSKVMHDPREQQPLGIVAARQREGGTSGTGVDRRALLLGLLAGGQLLQLPTSGSAVADSSRIETVSARTTRKC